MTTLTMQDEKRLEMIHRVYRKERTVIEAALVLGLSERQCYWVKARVGKAGAKGVVHGNRGRVCKRKTQEKMVRRVVALARERYQGFNDHHVTEKLAYRINLFQPRNQSDSTLRRHLIPCFGSNWRGLGTPKPFNSFR